jgi:phosphate transport system protein
VGKHLSKELDVLQKTILSLATSVEEQVRSAVHSVERKDVDAARKVIEYDSRIDLLEIEVEEECLKILALHQPVAIDLRFIVAVMKINNDLERIGDLASNIADRAIALAENSSFQFVSRLPLMCEKALSMLNKCLDAFFKMDTDAAYSVCKSDDEVDALYREMVNIVRKGIKENIENLSEYLYILTVSRSLERIADHATNIAEDVIYMLDGGIIRHPEARLSAEEQAANQ